MAWHRSPLLPLLIFAPQFTFTSLEIYPGHQPTDLPISLLTLKAEGVESVGEGKDRNDLGDSSSQSDSDETGSTTLEKICGDGDGRVENDSRSSCSSCTVCAESEEL
ncbi:Hypothetical predicted protein [Cloeon dipterum]|uniref:Uncharacterized protein n=1 Tax=Cloeon dipterum TaxID=197152 RepID=A0A8S1DHR2_9INSE|nr:Hypothetical predicted protein [Cloeon dipterum]